jgi:pimeloyl-ACP methyl ester carboxylesterase
VRRRPVLAALLTFVLLAAGCTANDTPTPAPSPGSTDTPVTWVDCRAEAKAIADKNGGELPSGVDFQCGSVLVPQDWNAAGDGKMFEIALMRAVKGSPDGKLSVLTNPGGPGGSGLDFLPYLAGELTNLISAFNVVSFDPRGVGKSDPVKCISDEDLDASFGYDPDPVSQTAFDGNVKIANHIADGCGAKFGDQLGLFNTEQTARDMDAIRAAVGDEKLTYLGFSYGTLLGAVYAELFPTKVRAMVLDGAVDPQQTPVQSSEGQAMGFERALDNFSVWCKANVSKCAIAADPRGAIVQAVDSARTNPVKGSGGRLATSGWVLWGVIFAMYSQDNWKYVGPAIDNLRKGNPGLIFAMADSYAERDEQGHYSTLFDANNAVNCADANYPTVEEIRVLQSQWRAKYPLFGAPLATGLLTCAAWPAKKDPYPVGPATGAPPIVVVGTTGDPATPYESTMKLADMLGVGQVLTWEGEGHTAYPTTTCIRKAVDSYLIDLRVPEKGQRCPAS